MAELTVSGVDRRGLLVAAVGGLLAGCGVVGEDGQRPAAAAASPSHVPTIAPPTEPRSSPPAGEGPLSDVRRLAADAGMDELRRQVPILGGPPQATDVSLVATQLAGLDPMASTAPSAGVFVLADLAVPSPTLLRVVRRVAYVRLGRAATGPWGVEEVVVPAPPQPADVAATATVAATADPAAHRLLQHPQLTLPADAAQDLLAGRCRPGLLAALGRLADQHDLQVTVLVSGHPRLVFGTTFVSNHAVGCAVDVWAVDGVPVAAAQPDRNSPAFSLLRLALADPAWTEIGVPRAWVDQAPPSRLFANLVHDDHLHLAAEADRPPL